VTHSRLTLLVALGLTLLAGCGPDAPPPGPVEITAGTACALDGMLLKDYPGPKAQIHYDNNQTEYYCDTVEMFNMLLRPESARRVRSVYTQDMGKADWKEPRGQWIDARTAWYVQGSKIRGSMGPTFAAFALKADAEAFAKKHDGKVLKFDEVKPDMVDLHGGAEHDHRM
jgi:copper chaperone NosL